MSIKTVRIVGETDFTIKPRKKSIKKKGGSYNVASAGAATNAATTNAVISKVTSETTSGTTNRVTGGATNAVTNAVTNAATTNPSSWLKYPDNTPVSPQVNRINYVYKGGKQDVYDKKDTRQVKVELKKKTTSKKVHLNPKTVPKTVPKLKKHTKKVRKFILGISKFHKRITRAKKVHKKIKELPLDKLKEKLIKDGLIKSTSKAPESVLRQIANDTEIVNKRAL